MPEYVILETENGLTVAEAGANESAEAVALRHNGVVVDPGPFKSYEDAQDALLLLPPTDEEDADPDEPTTT